MNGSGHSASEGSGLSASQESGSSASQGSGPSASEVSVHSASEGSGQSANERSGNEGPRRRPANGSINVENHSTRPETGGGDGAGAGAGNESDDAPPSIKRPRQNGIKMESTASGSVVVGRAVDQAGPSSAVPVLRTGPVLKKEVGGICLFFWGITCTWLTPHSRSDFPFKITTANYRRTLSQISVCHLANISNDISLSNQNSQIRMC
jgi:hypothetical protein